MKITAIILAGGIGSRMNTNIPKQFIEYNGVPIIINTIKNFEINPRITNIVIVCLKQYHDYLKQLVQKYELKKVYKIVESGETGHDSTRNGVFSLKNDLGENDYIIIHDSVRPILPQVYLNEMIDTALSKGNACLSFPCYETVVKTEDKISGNEEIDRNSFILVQTPQMFNYQKTLKIYEQADLDNKHDFVYVNTAYIHYGEKLFFSKGFKFNIKITTKEDLLLYKALLKLYKEEDN